MKIVVKYMLVERKKDGMESFDFLWEYYGQELPMQFLGGLVGSEQDDDLTLRPVTAWAIVDK